MSDKERKSVQKRSDDSAAYEQAQHSGVQAEDPLAAFKALRLEQLAVCRLKTAQEMQAMRDGVGSDCDEEDVTDS